MILIINDEPYEFEGKTLNQLLNDLDKNVQGIAVAIDHEVVPKSLWSSTQLEEGSQVFIFESIAGG